MPKHLHPQKSLLDTSHPQGSHLSPYDLLNWLLVKSPAKKGWDFFFSPKGIPWVVFSRWTWSWWVALNFPKNLKLLQRRSFTYFDVGISNYVWSTPYSTCQKALLISALGRAFHTFSERPWVCPSGLACSLALCYCHGSAFWSGKFL